MPRGGSPENINYPVSLMGTIALARQTLLDAQWYHKAHAAYAKKSLGQQAPEINPALEQLGSVLSGVQPFVVEVDDDLMLLRALKLTEEFGIVPLLVRGSGYEYRILDWLKRKADAGGIAIILPAKFPADGLKKRDQVRANIRRAIQHGLDADAALAALTTTPAEMLGVAAQLGTLEKGKRAHLVVTDGDLFAEETKILEVWVDGERYVVNPRPQADVRGQWDLSFELPDRAAFTLQLNLEGKPAALKGKILQDSLEIAVKQISLEQRRISLVFAGDSLGVPGFFQLRGGVEDSILTGVGRTPDGTALRWRATYADSLPADTTVVEISEPPEVAPKLLHPPGAFGLEELPHQPEYVLIRGATLWTSGPDGVIDAGDLLVHRGKIKAVGTDLDAPKKAVVIDAVGKHLTPGLVDAHAHIATDGGFNEMAQAVS
jgi:hypothetical protein